MLGLELHRDAGLIVARVGVGVASHNEPLIGHAPIEAELDAGAALPALLDKIPFAIRRGVGAHHVVLHEVERGDEPLHPTCEQTEAKANFLLFAHFVIEFRAVGVGTELGAEGVIEVSVDGEGLRGVEMPDGTGAAGGGLVETVNGGGGRTPETAAGEPVDGLTAEIGAAHTGHHDEALLGEREHVVDVVILRGGVGLGIGGERRRWALGDGGHGRLGATIEDVHREEQQSVGEAAERGIGEKLGVGEIGVEVVLRSYCCCTPKPASRRWAIGPVRTFQTISSRVR